MDSINLDYIILSIQVGNKNTNGELHNLCKSHNGYLMAREKKEAKFCAKRFFKLYMSYLQRKRIYNESLQVVARGIIGVIKVLEKRENTGKTHE